MMFDRIGLQLKFIKMPSVAAKDGTKKTQLVFEVEGDEEVDKLPLDHLKEFLGGWVDLQVGDCEKRREEQRKRADAKLLADRRKAGELSAVRDLPGQAKLTFGPVGAQSASGPQPVPGPSQAAAESLAAAPEGQPEPARVGDMVAAGDGHG